MTIEGGYKEAQNNQLKMIQRKNKQGMNFPCPLSTCVLTFSTESNMKSHMDEGNHSLGEFCGINSTVDDRVKMNWIQGLSGKVETRKTGIVNMYFPFSFGPGGLCASVTLAIFNKHIFFFFLSSLLFTNFGVTQDADVLWAPIS